MLTPRSIPGEVVSPRILRHAPSCDILVTMRAPDKWDSARFQAVCVAWSFFRSRAESHPAHLRLTQTVGRSVRVSKKVQYTRETARQEWIVR